MERINCDGLVTIERINEGFTVTLLNKKPANNNIPNGRRHQMLDRRLSPTKSSVATSTGIDYPKYSVGTHAHDGCYTSSYQVAHGARGTFPSVGAHEFPQQRTEPSRINGNFTIGAYGSGEIFSSYGGHRKQFLETDPYKVFHQRTNETFMSTLRNYSSFPERSVSSELINKLLEFTQTKHSINNSKLKNNMSFQAQKVSKKKSMVAKNLQTYTRSNRTRDFGSNTCHDDLRYDFSKRRRNSPKTSTFSRYTPVITTAYNYLQSDQSRGRYNHQAEVRYFNGMRKCIKDTLQQICSDEPAVCPMIKSRYSQHQKDCQGRNSQDGAQSSSRLSTGVQEDFNDLRTPSSCVKLPSNGTCEPSPGVCPIIKSRYSQHQKYCQRRSSQDGAQSSSRISTGIQATSSSYMKLPLFGTCGPPPGSHQSCQVGQPSKCGLCNRPAPCACKSVFVPPEILQWLKDLPVYANEPSENKLEREEKVQNLIESIQNIENVVNFEEAAKAEVLNCVNNLPMWLPESQTDQDQFKSGLADSLWEKLKNTDRIKTLCSLQANSKENQLITSQDYQNEISDLISNFPGIPAYVADDINKKISDLLAANDDKIPVQLDSLIPEIVAILADADIPELEANELAKDIVEKVRSMPKVIAKTRKISDVSGMSLDSAGLPKYNTSAYPRPRTRRLSPTIEESDNAITSKRKLSFPDEDYDKSKQTCNKCNRNISSFTSKKNVVGTETENNETLFDENSVKTCGLQTCQISSKPEEDQDLRVKPKTPSKVNNAKKTKKDVQNENEILQETPRASLSKKQSPERLQANKRTSKGYSEGILPKGKEEQDQLTNQIKSWIKSAPVNLSTTSNGQLLVDDLAKDIIDRQKYLSLNPQAYKSEDDELENLRYQVFRWLNKLQYKGKIDDIMGKVKDLMDGIKNGENGTQARRQSRSQSLLQNAETATEECVCIDVNTKPTAEDEPQSRRPAEQLFNNIQKWTNDLPIKSETPEEIQIVTEIRKNIAEKIKNKVVELNMDPEVFSDDYIYEDLLADEIDYLLEELNNEDINQNITNLRNDLIKKIKETRDVTQEDMARQFYKVQLRNTVSNTLPPDSSGQRESFEILRDNLADAFITANFEGNKCLRNKYKQKIRDEIDKYARDYLKPPPCKPIDSKKLNDDLYKALQNVSVPSEETIRNEVQNIKVKDVITEWAKSLPLDNKTSSERLLNTKKNRTLTKKVCDIMKQRDNDPDLDANAKLTKTVSNWIKKQVPQVSDNEIDNFTKKLVNDLQNLCECLRDEGTDTISEGQCCLPPSNLSSEDRDYLEKIRQRACQSKDESVSPIPIDTGSQTEVCPVSKINCSCNKNKDKPTIQAVGSQAEEAPPQIIIKEYIWDSNENCARLSKMYSPPPCSHPKPCPTRHQCQPQTRNSQHMRTPRESAQIPSAEIPECSSFRPRITRLGSLDHIDPKSSMSRINLSWQDGQLDKIVITSDDDEFFRGRREDQVRCKCKERSNNYQRTYPNNREPARKCRRCCGVKCPYPTNFYFR